MRGIVSLIVGISVVVVIMLLAVIPMIDSLDDGLVENGKNTKKFNVLKSDGSENLHITASTSYIIKINDVQFNPLGGWDTPVLALNGQFAILGTTSSSGAKLLVTSPEFGYYVSTSIQIADNEITIEVDDGDPVTIPYTGDLFYYSTEGPYVSNALSWRNNNTVYLDKGQIAYITLSNTSNGTVSDPASTSHPLFGMWTFDGRMTTVYPLTTYNEGPTSYGEDEVRLNIDIEDLGSYYGITATGQPQRLVDDTWVNVGNNRYEGINIIVPADYTMIDAANVPIVSILHAFPILLIGALFALIFYTVRSRNDDYWS